VPSDDIRRDAARRDHRQTRRENFAQAIDVLRAHRMRSGLLILGVAIGITTILMMVTVLSGLSRKINKDMVSANRPYIYVQKFDFIVGGEDEEQMKREDLTFDDARALERECPSLDAVCYFVQSQENYQVSYAGERSTPQPILGSSHAFPEIYTIAVEKGRFFTEDEEARRARAIVLAYGPARDLFPHEDPVGKYVRLGGERYKVVGTFATRHHIMGGFSDNFVVIPHSSYAKDFQREGDFTSISATVRAGLTLDDGIEDITSVLRVRRGVRPGQENNFEVLTSESFLDLVRRVTVPIGIVLTIIASIGLLVGGIGVMNIMLISVTERTREIGVRMAIGARKGDIMTQFLVEASTLTGIGGVAGTVLGTILAWVVSRLIHFPFYFSVPWTVTAVVFSVGVGIVFGLYPARRAAHMDPVAALRHE
jgi:putative ABC transport system permease protein